MDVRCRGAEPPPPPPPAPRASQAPRCAERAAAIHPLTLTLSPRELDAAFWRDAGTPALARGDRYALCLTTLNTGVLWLAMRSRARSEHLLDACSRPVLGVVKVLHVGSLWAAIATMAASVVAPRAYWRVREPLIIAQRLARAVNTPLVQACTSTAAYERRIVSEVLGDAGPPIMTPVWWVFKHVSLLGVFWVIQVLLFAFRLRWAAPIQLAAATVGAVTMRTVACAARAHPETAAAAEEMCRISEAVGSATLTAEWPEPGDWSRCAEAPVEYLVALIFTFTSVLPLYVAYCRERHLKVDYLIACGHMPARSDWGPVGSAFLRHALAAVCVAMASILAADAAVFAGWRFDCP